jgi:hypothetical protein
MIAELAAFNAAFGVVKTAITHGRDIASCAKSIGDMIGAQESLRARGEKKKNSIWYSLAGKDTNDFEEFMALEQIREQRKELLQALQLLGRPGLKDDYLRFEAEARRQRRTDAAEAEARSAKMVEWGFGTLAVIAAIGVLGYGLFVLGQSQGKW